MMKVPPQTAQLFEVLSKGQFISSNCTDELERKLFNTLDNEENYDCLYEYFRQINFILEKGDGYYYFARLEAKADFERKLEQAFKWIDILDFFKTYDNAFGPGTRFTPSDIMVQFKVNTELKTKIEGLKRYTANRTKHLDILEKILVDMRSERFLEIENEVTGQYKVLSSYRYLEELILTIHITEEAQNEIPQ